ncbi:MAG: MBL fold metallo-hydrolase, partial [Actinomycetota bacterium]|nr:MBL fold metallo-hydrolase [Actinomycetota bacterium]
MFFKQFYLQGLGHASYLVGSEQTGEALLFDPRRDVDGYFEAARMQGLRVRFAADSHGHNDYLSGLTEVAARGDVELLGSAEGELGYARRPLHHGEQLEFGEVGIEVLHTPGHTPEHISLLVHDRDASAEVPAMLLSGGRCWWAIWFVRTCSVARSRPRSPPGCSARPSNRRSWSCPTTSRCSPPTWPGRCGGNIGSRLSTTLGYERRTNAILAKISSEGEFVEQCLRLDNLPAVPPYWKRMRRQNLAGVAPLGVLAEPVALEPHALEQAIGDGAVVLDTRSPEAFGGGHVPGALNVGLDGAFATWAGTVLPEDAAVVLVLDLPADLWSATWELLRIGYPPPLGWLAGGMM